MGLMRARIQHSTESLSSIEGSDCSRSISVVSSETWCPSIHFQFLDKSSRHGGDITIVPNDDDQVKIEQYELLLSDEKRLDIEVIIREDWVGMSDPCPECSGTEFDYVRYEGGHYGHYEGTVIKRTDYWYQKGSIYTVCKDCDEVLYKNPAYDVLEAVATGEFEILNDRDYDSI